MKNKIDQEISQQLETLNVQTTPEKIVPKFCTTINIGLLGSKKNLVLTMAYSEGKENAALIERVIIDIDHAKSLQKVLTKVLGDIENETTDTN